MTRSPVSAIVYYGTPSFAVAPLAALCSAGWPVKAVVTAPDKQAGRGRKMRMSAVKSFALEQGLPVLQPERLNDPEFISRLNILKPDLQIVVAFRKLPEPVWALPKLGTVNLHASLLPQYRGAAPINHAIINGENTTGLTTFFINKNIDTGDILMKQRIPINDDDDFGTLHDRMMHSGSELVLQTVEAIAQGNEQSQQQSAGASLKAAPKLTRNFCRIDWNKNAVNIHNLVRGLSPAPGAWTLSNADKVVKIFRTSIEDAGERPSTEPGTVRIEGDQLFVSCANGRLSVLEIQMEGKKRMHTPDFIRGLQENQLITFK